MSKKPRFLLLVSAAVLLCAAALPAAEISPCDSPGGVMNVATSSDLTGSASANLTWGEARGASTYDVYLGPTDPPPIWAEGITGTSLAVNGLADGTTYYWYVVAHAECDPTLTTRTETQSFKTTGSCQAVGSFSPSSPAQGATNVSTLASFSWSPAGGASSYDLYLGRTSDPALVLPGITTTSIDIPRLLPATTYYWKVVARSACNPSSSTTSAIWSFTVTSNCPAPDSTSITFVPPSDVEIGQTYAIAWQESEGIDAGGSYIVERSSSSSFGSILDRQQTTSTSASFVSESTGTFYHRVRAVSGCNESRVSSWSAPQSVRVVEGKASVIFTRPPEPVITNLGDPLEDERRSFTIENIGPTSVQVIVSRREVNSVPFFQIFDPLGENAAFFTLAPRQPKTLDLRFSGPPNDVAGSYQGIIAVTVIGQQVSVNPYAWINLKVGGGTSASPVFLVNGLESEYAFFPPKKGDDSDRPSISVDILNNGTQPMELASEIGPEVWLFPEANWNAGAIPAKGFKPVRLSTLRFLAPNNSALPRYTYFTVRNRDGGSARLLVQDNTAFETGTGRPALATPSERSFIIPTVTSKSLGGGAQELTRIRLTNVGGAAVQTEFLYTPTGQDGLGTSVQRASVVLPPNDVVNITDPLAQIFGLTRPATGQLEIRSAPEKIGLLMVSASVETRPVGGGSFQQHIPTLFRGEGAIVGSNHVIAGLARDATRVTDLVLAETTGRDAASVRVTLRDSTGASRGNQTVGVPRYGRMEIADVVQALGGGSSGTGFRVDIETMSGGGAVVGVASTRSTSDRGASSLTSRPAGETPAISTLGRDMSARIRNDGTGSGSGSIGDEWLRVLAGGNDVYAVPLVVSGLKPLTGDSGAWRTELILTNAGSASVQFDLAYTDDTTGQTKTASETLGPGASKSIANVVTQLGISQASRGAMLVETTAGGRVFALLHADLSAGVLSEPIPVVSVYSESLTASGSYKPLVADAIEQSVDSTRGTRSNLILTEIAGQSASVLVRLYEAGNRISPIAEKEINIPAGRQMILETIFDSLGLSSNQRQKDRTNVQCVVVPTGSSGLVSAVLQTIDNRTGETTLTQLQPAGGSPATGIQKVPVEPTEQPGRRRPVRRR